MPRFAPRNTALAQELRRQATPAERRLWRYLRASQLDGHKFSRQMPIGPYFCDFLCRAKGLVVELDGFSHESATEKDQRRRRYLEAQGLQVIRFTNAQLYEDVEGVVEAIHQALSVTPTPNPSRKREGDS